MERSAPVDVPAVDVGSVGKKESSHMRQSSRRCVVKRGSRPSPARAHVGPRHKKGGDHVTMATRNAMTWAITQCYVQWRAGDFLVSVYVEVQVLIHVGTIGD
jgi:hypothetical protein